MLSLERLALITWAFATGIIIGLLLDKRERPKRRDKKEEIHLSNLTAKRPA